VPRTRASCADVLWTPSARSRVRYLAGGSWPRRACDDRRLAGLKLVFLIVSRAVSLLGLSRRESWWKDAGILMLRHQLAVAEREHPRAHSRLTWPDRAWLALLAGTLPTGRLAAMGLIVIPGTILRGTAASSAAVGRAGRARERPRAHQLGFCPFRRPHPGNDGYLRPRRVVLHPHRRERRAETSRWLRPRHAAQERHSQGGVARGYPDGAAVLAAHAGSPGEAADRLAEARAAAGHLPDGIYHGTAFGPSGVRVHELAMAVELGSTGRALQVISQWHPTSALPAERRSHFHIEAARAYHWAGKPDQALGALMEARQAAPLRPRQGWAMFSTTRSPCASTR
jgi:hypothetical protein